MALSHVAKALAGEIAAQDWSDAHTRADGARHDRKIDRTSSDQMTRDEWTTVQMNVVWVVGQALREVEPDFSIREFAEASNVAPDYLLTRRGTPNGGIEAGLRPRREGIEITRQGAGWAATDRNARPRGRLSTVVAATPEAALATLLGHGD